MREEIHHVDAPAVQAFWQERLAVGVAAVAVNTRPAWLPSHRTIDLQYPLNAFPPRG
jgi:hypothetical protein